MCTRTWGSLEPSLAEMCPGLCVPAPPLRLYARSTFLISVVMVAHVKKRRGVDRFKSLSEQLFSSLISGVE
jgi:hypothetical protein